MAERRMFAKTIVLSDNFLDMPLSARCLYFTLGMFADDDGFVNNPKAIMRQCGASQDDLNILIVKSYIIVFGNGIIVIKHWRINNYLRSDRYQETKCIKEKKQLVVDTTGTYDVGIPNNGIPSIDKDSIDKDSIDKDSIDKDSIDKDSKNTNIDIVKRIIEYLNNRCGTKYRHSSENTKKCINARLNEGYTEEDFYTVIDKKANEWLGTPREEYLRPITLFSPKFESYLNQKINKDTSTGNAYIDSIKNRISEVDSWV